MAVDATGTPTTLGIPRFDVANDAPSGLGFNAAMVEIDTLIQGRMEAPASPSTGDTLVWNGSAWVAQAPTTPASSTPAGVVVEFAGASAPTGWLMADGAAVSRSTYSDLFAAISTAYGAGDGSTTFNVPDMRGRVGVGKGTHVDVDTLGKSDGSALASRRPKHAHTVNDPSHHHGLTNVGSGGINAGGSGGGLLAPSQGTSNTQDAVTGITVGQAGVTDTPAYLVVNYIIKT